MDKKSLFLGLSIIVLLGALVWLAQPNTAGKSQNNSTSNTGSLVALENNYDFGNISMAKGKVRHTFAIKNNGTAPVKIQKMYTSCMCTESTLTLGNEKFGPFGMAGHGFMPSIDKELAAGQEAQVEIEFDPAAHGPAGIGLIKRLVRIEHGAGDPLDINFQTYVTP